MSENRIKTIRACLTEALEPADLEVIDEGHLHIGHAGSKDGRGHFRVKITSNRFLGLPPLRRHRLIYDALGELMETEIHALGIEAATVEEGQKLSQD